MVIKTMAVARCGCVCACDNKVPYSELEEVNFGEGGGRRIICPDCCEEIDATKWEDVVSSISEIIT